MSHTKFIYSYLNSILEQVQESFCAKQIQIIQRRHKVLKENTEIMAFDN